MMPKLKKKNLENKSCAIPSASITLHLRKNFATVAFDYIGIDVPWKTHSNERFFVYKYVTGMCQSHSLQRGCGRN